MGACLASPYNMAVSPPLAAGEFAYVYVWVRMSCVWGWRIKPGSKCFILIKISEEKIAGF